jgi:hypothetical protein
VINHWHVIDKLTTFIQSCKQHWDARNDCKRHDSRQRRIWEKNFQQENLIHFWQHFDFEFFSRTILKDFDNDRSDLIMLKSIEEEFHTNDITKILKKIFFKQTEKIDKENNKSEKEIWSKTKKKKSSFKSKNFFTSHFRFSHYSFSHSSFTFYSIFHSWKTIVFDEFQKESHKKFDLNFESIEVIIFTMSNAKNKHFSHERRMISRMKEDIHSREW